MAITPEELFEKEKQLHLEEAKLIEKIIDDKLSGVNETSIVYAQVDKIIKPIIKLILKEKYLKANWVKMEFQQKTNYTMIYLKAKEPLIKI